MFQDGLLYQDSRMSTEEEFLKELSPFDIRDVETVSEGGPVLFQKGDQVYTDSGESHSLIVGDTGSGKTLRYILPLIYSCAMAEESMVIVDPKGELEKKMGGFLREKGYSVHVLNWRKPQHSPDRWNPMGIIEHSYAMGEEGKKNAMLQMNDLFHNLFYARSSADKDKYWNESAGSLAMGICGVIQLLGEELTIKNLLKWRYENIPNGRLRRCFDALSSEEETYQNLAGYMNLTAENTKSCILSTFDQLMRLFKASPALTDMLSSSTFDMDEIGIKKTAVFLVIPDEKTTFHFLATLFISQCYEALLDKAEVFGGVLPVRVNFIMEEFCNMPRVADIVPMLTAARSRKIRFHLVIQSYFQMVDKYSENISRTILDNCNLIYLHSREYNFLSYLSQLAGNNEYGRPVLSTSRLQHLQKNETVIFQGRCYPFIAQDVPMIFEYPVRKEKTVK